MSLSWKLLPLAAMFALGVLALVPGGGVKDTPTASAAISCSNTFRLRIDIVNDDTGARVPLDGSRVRVSPDPQDNSGTGTYTDGSTRDGNTASIGRIDELDACSATANDYTIDLLDLPGSFQCNNLPSASTTSLTGNTTVTLHVSTCPNTTVTPTLTPTVTGTVTSTPTLTPTATATSGPASGVTVSAAPNSVSCGSGASFITVVVKNASGGTVADGTVVNVSASIGSVSPSQVTTTGASSGSSGALTVFSAPASAGTASITATAGGVSGTTAIAVTCAAAQPTTPPPPPVVIVPTAIPAAPGTVRPPNTGDAGLANDSDSRTYLGVALLVVSVLGAGVVVRKRA